MTKKLPIDISVIVTTHAESILIHRTLSSVRRALKELEGTYSYEIILHADNPTADTLAYINLHKDSTLRGVQIFKNAFKDLGLSRNFSVEKAQGKYIATIDADDLMSKNWLRSALDFLEAQSEPTVAHTEITIEFEGADSLVIKHGEIDLATDTLLSVFANRWNSVIVVPRSLILEEKYTANSPGYGYEDWHLNSRLIKRGIHNVLIPHTALFVRRKKSNSEWQRQIESMAVLRANPLLSFDHIRSITNPFATSEHPASALSSTQNLKSMAKNIIKQYPFIHKIARRTQETLKRRRVGSSAYHPPAWLIKEWREIHSIERQLFPTDHLLHHIETYDSITLDHKQAGNLYKQLVDSLAHDSYDYIIFVPWLIKGGADRYAINYANTIARLQPAKRVLVVATLPVSSLWIHLLDKEVGFLDFGTITNEASAGIKYRLMSHIIENSGASHLHIINSEFGYDFIQLHQAYVKNSDKKVVLTSFSQSVDKDGRLYGYSHTHVPFVYDQASLITSDNEAVIQMWQSDYGFDSTKLLVHRQPISLPSKEPEKTKRSADAPLRILWAARLAPEKQPELLAPIAKELDGIATIDVYGSIEHGYHHIADFLPANASYKGSFDDIDSLPLADYDVLLYTSLFDGMPNILLEVAQAKLPIVASSVGGIPEFIQNDKTGILVADIRNPKAYTEAILRLKDIDYRTKLGNAAYEKLAHDFSSKGYEKNVGTMLKKLDY